MKKIMLFFVSILFTLASLNAQSYKGDLIVGKYFSPDGVGQIEIFKRSGKYYGKTICCNKKRLDINNPNPALRVRSRIGIEFIHDFEFDGDEEYINGTIYNPEDGRTYSAKMWLDGRDLNMRGYIGAPILGKTIVFTRIEKQARQ
ncbi:MAG: DUF2147 domain-containing protein [Bacteroidota bacterium]